MTGPEFAVPDQPAVPNLLELAAPSPLELDLPDRLVFVVPADLGTPTGGNRYDVALAGAMAELGTKVELRPAAGSWPAATPADQERLGHLLRADVPVLVDGLLACGAPRAVRDATAVSSPASAGVHVLVHLPLALESGLSRPVALRRNSLERSALRAATSVLATSQWAAADLRERHGLEAVTVAAPGTDLAPASSGSTPPKLLQLAAISPLKNQLTFLEALALIPDLPWTANLTGRLDVDHEYTANVRAAIDRHGLTGRVQLTGPVSGEAWRRIWDGADLLVLPSHTEMWGLVVTEALARGVPAVVGLGTGAQEALATAPDGTLPGAAVPPDDPVALAAAIRHLLGPGRDLSRRAARLRRASLRSWRQTAQDVLKALVLERY